MVFCLCQALGYLQKCPEFSLPRAVATRAVGALGSPVIFFPVFSTNGVGLVECRCSADPWRYGRSTWQDQEKIWHGERAGCSFHSC